MLLLWKPILPRANEAERQNEESEQLAQKKRESPKNVYCANRINAVCFCKNGLPDLTNNAFYGDKLFPISRIQKRFNLNFRLSIFLIRRQ